MMNMRRRMTKSACVVVNSSSFVQRTTHRSASSAGAMARAKPPKPLDALAVFTLLLSHCLALQVAKDAQRLVEWRSLFSALPTILLATAIIRANRSPSSTGRLADLSHAGVLVLLVNGSQSNHVLLELATCVAVAIATWGKATSSGGADANAIAVSSSRRAAVEDRLVRSCRAILFALYLSTGVAKLNDAWHDPKTSCCVGMFVAAASTLGVSASFSSPAVLRAMPYAATVFELSFPTLLWVASRYRDDAYVVPWLKVSYTPVVTRRKRAKIIMRCLCVAGAAFHVVIALPPPPMSAYPFRRVLLYTGSRTTASAR
jgi:hypothetical protein